MITEYRKPTNLEWLLYVGRAIPNFRPSYIGMVNGVVAIVGQNTKTGRFVDMTGGVAKSVPQDESRKVATALEAA